MDETKGSEGDAALQDTAVDQVEKPGDEAGDASGLPIKADEPPGEGQLAQVETIAAGEHIEGFEPVEMEEPVIPLTTKPTAVRGLVRQTKLTPEERIHLGMAAGNGSPGQAGTVAALVADCRGVAARCEEIAEAFEAFAAGEADEHRKDRLRMLARGFHSIASGMPEHLEGL